MFWQFPEALSEMVTGQGARALVIPVGLPLLAMILVGAWSQWRRGNRLICFLALSFPAGTAFLLGGWAMRPRYIMPIQFLLTFLCLHGLRVFVEALSRLRRKPLAPQGCKRVLEIFVALAVAFNAPRVAKVSFYHSYLSLSGQFYNKIRHGDFVELPAVCDVLRRHGSSTMAVAAPRDKVSIFHFLTGDRILSLPPVNEEDALTEVDAEAIIRFVHSREDVGLVVFDWFEGSESFRRRLEALVEADADLLPVRELKQFRIYRRAGTPQPAKAYPAE